MNTRPWWALLVLFALSAIACPTRTVTDGNSGRDAAAGKGGNGGSGGHLAVGAGGSAGKGDAGGQAGSSPEGSGGQAGAPAIGTGGQAGVVVAAAGGQAGAVPAGTGGQAGGPAAGGSGGRAGSAGVGGAGGQGGAPSAGGTGGTPAKAKDGERCALSSDCASAACTPFYVDLDGDGYGAGQAVGFCGTSAPVGYAPQSGDCCDTATNLTLAKLIHPGADFQATSAGGVCNITWDYDCSGKVESSPDTVASCAPWPSCATVFGSYPETACGTSTDQSCSCTGAGGSCFTVCGGHPSVPITCK
ncbi:MAG TPA: hypothetical protein VHM31_11175 [Polyangia bacterium]|nr:hypothetical protein [Polyangia bacterium]